MNARITLFSLLLLILSSKSFSQEKLSSEHLAEHTSYFLINDTFEISEEVAEIISNEATRSNIFALAELHGDSRLSLFTTSLLKTLSSSGYKDFALELGPYSAQILQELASNPDHVSRNISEYQNKYGRKFIWKTTPLVFVNRESDAMFIREASELGFQFWGFDQEYIHSFEMHIDRIYNSIKSGDAELDLLYELVKNETRDLIWKDARNKSFKLSCELLESRDFNHFLNIASEKEKVEDYVHQIKKSLEIYCIEESGEYGSTKRAKYMKGKFDEFMNLNSASQPKLFIKMGNVHLTKGISPFGVEDLGNHISTVSDSLNLTFTNFRYLRRWQDGKDLLGKKGWESLSLFREIAREDKWTLIDLRTLREEIKQGNLKGSDWEEFEIRSYDFILISSKF